MKVAIWPLMLITLLSAAIWFSVYTALHLLRLIIGKRASEQEHRTEEKPAQPEQRERRLAEQYRSKTKCRRRPKGQTGRKHPKKYRS